MEQISELLLEEISERFDQEPLSSANLEFSESFAEILDRFLVLHIRLWKLEDATGVAKSDAEVADLKRKLDYCFKDRRPKMIRAINCFLDAYIDRNHARKFSEENVKLYQGYGDRAPDLGDGNTRA